MELEEYLINGLIAIFQIDLNKLNSMTYYLAKILSIQVYRKDQCSGLGPILFLIYINDLPNFDDSRFTIMFADDGSLFISGPNLADLKIKAEHIIAKVKVWIATNKLSHNLNQN